MRPNERWRTGVLALVASVMTHLALGAVLSWSGHLATTPRPITNLHHRDFQSARAPGAATGVSPAARAWAKDDSTAVIADGAPSAAASTVRGRSSLADPIIGALLGAVSASAARLPKELAAVGTALGVAPRGGAEESHPIVTHLWQSTLFGGAIALLTLAFRQSRAGVRHGLWLSASLKFVVPLALLTTLGGQLPLGPIVQTATAPELATAPTRLDRLSGQAPAAHGASPDTLRWTRPVLISAWACGALGLVVYRLTLWRRIRATLRTSTPIRALTMQGIGGVSVRASAAIVEPSVVGWRRPVLLLPKGIERTLSAPQLDAVVAHELCHIRRADNATAAIHMIVETLFWFHPMVWWIGARMVHERERACDEAVLLSGHQPAVYAEGIISICKCYLGSPLACVTGVTGARLKVRIETIMLNQTAEALTGRARLFLASLGGAAVVAPIVFGMATTPRLMAQMLPFAGSVPSFETASVKPNSSGSPVGRLESQPGGRINAVNVSLLRLIGYAYDLPQFQLTGGPDWIRSERFDVVAKGGDDAPLAQKRAMLQQLLKERFSLVAHTEVREQPIYRLTMARSDRQLGPQLRPTTAPCGPREQSPLDNGVGFDPSSPVPTCNYFGFAPGSVMSAGRGGLAFRGMTMPELAKVVVTMVRRQVTDDTGLRGYFDGDFDVSAELPPPPPPPGLPNPWGNELISVFTVFPEQLGLRLQSARGPVPMLVVDTVEPPRPD
jgi:uncharacterized protein (TIGR03435 family)